MTKGPFLHEGITVMNITAKETASVFKKQKSYEDSGRLQFMAVKMEKKCK